ncbi:MAG: hypothetical protein HC876_20705 [Chloroflexaceae bacterium]|nr:hypothetical protein [Chloroflexaceae bacterium]
MNMMLKTPVATRTLHEWREAILQGILYAMLGFGSLALTSVIFKIWHLSQVNGEPFPLIRTALYVICYGITLLATFARQTPYRFRASVPIVALTIIGVSEFYVFGVSWEGILFLCVATILATLLLGLPSGLSILALTIVLMGTILMASSWPGFVLPFEALPALERTFVSDSIPVYLLLIATIVVATNYLIQGLQRSLATAAAAADELERANAVLEARVTERTEQLASALQEAEAARRAAEEASDLKTKFLANMSHELRTPLNSIINFTRIISSGVRGPVTDEQRDYLNRVQVSGEHLLGLINDILDLAKIEAGRMELFIEACSIADLVHSTMASVIGLTKDKPIKLHEEVPPNLPLIHIDKTRIRQVLLKLAFERRQVHHAWDNQSGCEEPTG